jgi:tetratricopeptide (TPR) repeat protein
VEIRALLEVGSDLAYLGRADEGIAHLRRALELADDAGDPLALLSAYVSLTDVLTMLGKPQESVRVGQRGLEIVRRYGIDRTVLVANSLEALIAIGEWDEADTASAAALRNITANFPYMLFMLRADIELGRGDFEAARSHLAAALTTRREDRGLGIYDVYLAELALWERRWTEADQAVRDGLTRATSRQSAQLRVWFCAKGLRAHAELAALARARRDPDAVQTWLARSRRLIAVARLAAKEASAVTPNTDGWLALAEAEYERAQGAAGPELWSAAGGLGPASTPTPGRLLPLAPSRDARRRRRLPHRGRCAAQAGAWHRSSDRSESAAARDRTARPTLAPRSDAAGARATRSTTRARADSRPDTTRGGGSQARRRRLHRPRDRGCPHPQHPDG